ncbi:uncharacterized protein HMPREF1541_07710 [Cyphellophora europaea CBS 101466]|uniref:Uncharacterized protein n=1 Tax=Cyphellophora europaea (strain CBS 101466) TaxID=1220924 RepID=W2RNI8_CYPE1|nr:uncharacterized protein HMPREF1541_07710 [Cyphellophora europaea CBS 101466]ETN38086.1 hypothetical protein HMPREF1541_07710 [Cyphellophora europaea CBS 101466]
MAFGCEQTTLSGQKSATPPNRKKKTTARLFTPVKKIKTGVTQRISLGPRPQRIVKPTAIVPLKVRGLQSHKEIEIQRFSSNSNATAVLLEKAGPHEGFEEANGRSAKMGRSRYTTAKFRQQARPRREAQAVLPAIVVEVKQQSCEDVDMTDISNLLDITAASTKNKPQIYHESPQNVNMLDSFSSARKSAGDRSKRNVHFTNTDQIQPFDKIHKPKDVKLLQASTQATSERLSFLRNPKMYDSDIRLQVCGSKLKRPVLLNLAGTKNMDALWKDVQLLRKITTRPQQVLFRLEEESKPMGYDTMEDEKRHKFGTRADTQFPAFITRCQEAARAKVMASEETDSGMGARVRGSGGVRRSRRLMGSGVVGVIELVWKE